MTAVNPLGDSFRIKMTNVSEYNTTFLDIFLEKTGKIIQSGQYILGNQVREFEEALCNYVGMPYAVCVGSGTSALELAFKSLKLLETDEVIIQANAYIACAFGAIQSNANLRIIDCDENGCFDIVNFKNSITPNTKAVLIVHLYGDSCNMEEVVEICNARNIILIEDCAQSLGSCWNSKKLGSFGDISCHSFYPTKNLGALGDGGAILCRSVEIANKIRKVRNLGSSEKYIHSIKGTNSRMDTLQAAFLLEKLPFIDYIIKQKQSIAQNYIKSGIPHIRNEDIRVNHSYHLFVIQTHDRTKLMKLMATNGIETIIHYPIPFYKSQAFQEYNHLTFPVTEKLANTILSIPIHTSLKNEDMSFIMSQFK